MLIVKYDRIDFFGSRVYTEDKKDRYTKEHVKKAMLFFGKDYSHTIQIEQTVIFWNNPSDYENRIVTVRKYNQYGYDDEKKSFEKVKKEVYAMDYKEL
jgi:hypothetical protein